MQLVKKSGLAVLALGMMMAPAIWAQDSQQAPPPPPNQGGPMQPGGMHGRPMSPEHQLRRMTRELNLNSDQQTQVGQILRDRDAQMGALHQNSAMPPQEQHQQMRQLMMDSDTRLRGVLNPQQLQKFDAMRAQQHEKTAERHGGMGAPPPGPQGDQAPPPQQ